MKNGAIAISFVVKIVLALIAILIVAGASKAITDEGSKQTDSSSDKTASLSGGTQCDIFCGGTIGMKPEDAVRRKCYTLTCKSKTYGFTCVDDPITPEPECANSCKKANDIPEDCKTQCADSLPNTECPSYLSRSGTTTTDTCVAVVASPPTPGNPAGCPQNMESCGDSCIHKDTEICCRSTGGTGGQGDGGTGILLKQCDPSLDDCGIKESWVATSTIKPFLYTEIWAMGDSGAGIKPIASPTIALTTTGANPPKCVDLGNNDCKEGGILDNEASACYSKDCFQVNEPYYPGGSYYISLAAPMKDGSYSLLITAKPDQVSEKKRTVAVSWKCPEIKFDKSSKFEPRGAVTASFESMVDANTLGVKINTHPYSTDELNTDPSHPKNVSFALPLVGVPDPGKDLRSGSNELIVGRYDAGSCIKTETTLVGSARVSTDYVKNEVRKAFTWVCPAVGCITTPDGKEYVATGLGSGTADPNTGCMYSTPGAECATGCFAGKCKEAKLEIVASIKLDGVTPSSTSKIYEFAGDRILTVAVKNTGSMAATGVHSGMNVVLGGIDLINVGDINCGNGAKDSNEDCDVAAQPGSGATCTTPKVCSWNCKCITAPAPPTIDYPTYKYNQNTLDPGATSQYFFAFPGGVPTIGMQDMFAPVTFNIVAAASNAPSVTKPQSITVYRCGAGCKLYTTQPICESCNNPAMFGCRWVDVPYPKPGGPTKMCDYKCIQLCGTFGTKDKCDACGGCFWNPSDSQPCSIAPMPAPT